MITQVISIDGDFQVHFNGDIRLSAGATGSTVRNMNITGSISGVNVEISNNFITDGGISVGGSGNMILDNRLTSGGISGSTASDTVVRGNTVISSNGHGIYLEGGNNTVKDNRIESSSEAGIAIGIHAEESALNLIENNVVLGSGLPSGILLGDGTSLSIVLGNHIGVVPLKNTVIPYEGPGMYVGGIRHTISGNTIGPSRLDSSVNDGIVLSGTMIDGGVGGRHIVEGNFIGTDSKGIQVFGNTGNGIAIYGVDNTIGGRVDGVANVIKFNLGSGVLVGSSDLTVRNRIFGNIISDNGGLGIDLGDDGVTFNDVNDADSGGNDLQNFPVLTVLPNGEIEGTLHSTPGMQFEIDFYSNDPGGHPSDKLEGQTHLGMISVLTNGEGNSPTFKMPFSVGVGKLVTATATDESGNTSEFSRMEVFVVNSVGDDPDASRADGNCDTGKTIIVRGQSVPECTLRAAIAQANADVGQTTIRFNIAAEPVIFLRSDLPVISAPISIDGSTDHPISPVVTLRAAAEVTEFLELNSAFSVIRNLRIEGSSNDAHVGILLIGNPLRTGGHTIQGVHIQNVRRGIQVLSQLLNTIGGPSASAANVFVNNGIAIDLFEAGSNLIEGNFIGTNQTGVAILGNDVGIKLESSIDNVIRGNTIAFNKVGMQVARGPTLNSERNRIQGNSIYGNSRLGIDLLKETDNVTLITGNDLLDTDVGPNGLQNFPDLFGARQVAGEPVIVGKLVSSVDNYQIEFFSTPLCHPSGYGEGVTPLGVFELAITENNGIADFTVPAFVLSKAPKRGDYITATATDSEGNTSEFSRCVRYDDEDVDGQLEQAGVDGNQDGTDDSQQPHVASFQTTLDQTSTLIVPEGQQLFLVTAVSNPSPEDVPSATFVMGFLSFGVTNIPAGGSTSVDLLLPSGVTANTYFMYGPTPDDPNPHWFEFAFDGTTGAEINGGVVKLHFVDGGRGDLDLTANGEILDPGAPAFVTVVNPRPWQNPLNSRDANGDGSVAPIDALVIINRLNSFGSHTLPTPNGQFAPPPYYDVDGDGSVSPIDVLLVINSLNSPSSEGETAPSTANMLVQGLTFEFWSGLANLNVAERQFDGRQADRSSARSGTARERTGTEPPSFGRATRQPNVTSPQATEPSAECRRCRATAATELLASLDSALVDDVFRDWRRVN